MNEVKARHMNKIPQEYWDNKMATKTSINRHKNYKSNSTYLFALKGLLWNTL